MEERRPTNRETEAEADATEATEATEAAAEAAEAAQVGDQHSTAQHNASSSCPAEPRQNKQTPKQVSATGWKWKRERKECDAGAGAEDSRLLHCCTAAGPYSSPCYYLVLTTDEYSVSSIHMDEPTLLNK